MPFVYNIKCDTCDFAKGLSEHVLFAEREDGKQFLLPHPCEYLVAESVTGMTLDQLEKLKRLWGRSGYVCLSCGTAGYYAKRDEGFEGATFADLPEGATFTGRLNTPAIITRLPDLRCANCNEEALEIAGGLGTGEPLGCLAALVDFLDLIKLKPLPPRPAPLCPQCHTGHMHWEFGGKS